MRHPFFITPLPRKFLRNNSCRFFLLISCDRDRETDDNLKGNRTSSQNFKPRDRDLVFEFIYYLSAVPGMIHPIGLIPLKIYIFILETADTSDLSALCRVNKSIHQLASDILYKTIDVVNILDVCTFLHKSPSLAMRVKHFAISVEAIRGLSGLHSSYVVIRDVLQCLKNLKSLRWIKRGPFSWNIAGCPAKLDTLECSLDCDHIFMCFLESQTELVALELWYGPQGHQLPTTALPKLNKIHAPKSWLSIIVSGRPIREVTYRENLFQESHILVDTTLLSASSSRINALSVGFPSLQALPMSQIATLLPYVETLSITVPQKFVSLKDIVSQLTIICSIVCSHK